MGDSKRFELVANYISKHFPYTKYNKIADIAGGQGFLQKELNKLHYNVVTFDKRHKHIKSNSIKYSFKYFDSKIKESFDLLVGLHPDEATDVIITEAIKRKIPFVVIPCCILPTITTFKGNTNSYKSWINHLKQYALKLGYLVEEYQLPMKGKNILLKGYKK